MASTTITITITDTAQVTLIDMRDTLAAAYGVNGGSTNQQKLDAIKARIIFNLKADYQAQKNASAAAAVQGLATQSDLS